MGVLSGLVYNTFIQVPEFKSNAKLLLVSPTTADITTSQTLLNNYIDLIQSRRVLEPVVMKQHDTISYENLVKAVGVVNQKNTAIIDVTVTTKNAQQSADIVNEITESFKTAATELYQSSGVIVVDPAVVPTVANNVNALMQLIVATAGGFFLAIVSGFFIFDYQRSHPRKKSTKNVIKTSTISKSVKSATKKTTNVKKPAVKKKTKN